jgi:hypothetical protein
MWPTVASRLGLAMLLLVLVSGEGCGEWGREVGGTMLNRIKAALGRVWRPRRRRSAEHGFYDQRAGSRYRSQQDRDAARGQSYEPPEGRTF